MSVETAHVIYCTGGRLCERIFKKPWPPTEQYWSLFIKGDTRVWIVDKKLMSKEELKEFVVRNYMEIR